MACILRFRFYYILLLAPIVALSGCITIENPYPALPPGIWRAVLKINPEFIKPNPKGKPQPDKVDMTYPDVEPGVLPFNFEVVYDNDSVFHIEIINGEERITLPPEDISFGRTRNRARDTIRIEFPIYDSYITGAFAGDVIEGQWVVRNRTNYAIPFVAKQGKAYRFTVLKKKPAADLTGKWKVTFGPETNDPYPAIGDFKQNGNHLTGTFLTETGDYRFLEGTVQGNKFWLSVFDGAHAFLFEGKILNQNQLTGAFYSGIHYTTTWEARRDPDAALAHPDSLTFLRPGYDALTFAFENPAGKIISPDNPEYHGKIKIIQILGTWCPNCRDETAFLTDYLKKNNPENLAVIGLAFEKYRDPQKANRAIQTYKEKFGINYEIVHAGYYNKDEAAKALPMLNHILSYPTMIFLDKNNKVKKIHTGFYGPATDQYDEFKKEFESTINSLSLSTPVSQKEQQGMFILEEKGHKS
ncbi:MAG TPA: TlpA family protein disulfide reductase [Bacteroidetes bacterium]|nr:TlpA family protein disulfide reductase [Bacteroidota bacterium]